MEKQAYTVPEFCKLYGISRGRFHELQQAKLAPDLYRIASKPYVSKQAAENWLTKMMAGAAEGFIPLPAKNPGQPGRVRISATA